MLDPHRILLLKDRKLVLGYRRRAAGNAPIIHLHNRSARSVANSSLSCRIGGLSSSCTMVLTGRFAVDVTVGVPSEFVFMGTK